MENQKLEKVPVSNENEYPDLEPCAKGAFVKYRFFRMPKLLLKDPSFQEISIPAKLLYSLMLDRTSLSQRNGWIDECGRVYVYFLETDAAAMLGCSRFKMIRLYKELSSYGMIERRRQGRGKPNRIYVKNFLSALTQPENLDGAELDSLTNHRTKTMETGVLTAEK